jgi:hypothetical protein
MAEKTCRDCNRTVIASEAYCVKCRKRRHYKQMMPKVDAAFLQLIADGFRRRAHEERARKNGDEKGE